MKLITFLLPSDGIGGGARAIMEFGNGLIKLGYQVRILYKVTPFSLTPRSLLKSFLRRNHMNWLDYFNGPIEAYSEDSLSHHFQQDGEVVIAMCSQTALDAQKLHGNVMKLMHCHGGEYEDWDRFLDAINSHMPKIAISHHVEKMIEKYSTSQVIAVVPDGINHSEYFYDREILREGVGGCIRPRHSKDPATTIKVFELLLDQRPETPLYSFGVGRPHPILSKVHYTNNPTVKEGRTIYNKCKVWFLTSLEEGFGLPVLEAMACGCVVVSTVSGGPQDMIVNGYNGFNVEIGNYGGIFNRIDRLLSDNALCSQMSINAIETAKTYSWDKSARLLQDELVSLADRFVEN